MNVIMQICSCDKLLPVLLTLFAISMVHAKKVSPRLGEACDFEYLEGRGTSYFLPDDFISWESVTSLSQCCEQENVPGCTPCPERESMLWSLEVENSHYIACTAVPESSLHIVNSRRNASTRRMNSLPSNAALRSRKNVKGNVRKTHKIRRQGNPNQRSDPPDLDQSELPLTGRENSQLTPYQGMGINEFSTYPNQNPPWLPVDNSYGQQPPNPDYSGTFFSQLFSTAGPTNGMRNPPDQRLPRTQNDCKPPNGLNFDDYYQPYPFADGPNIMVHYGDNGLPDPYAPNQQGIGYPYRDVDGEDPDRPPQAGVPYNVNDDASKISNHGNRQQDPDYLPQPQENTYFRRNISPNSGGISERKKHKRRRPRPHRNRREASGDYLLDSEIPADQ